MNIEEKNSEGKKVEVPPALVYRGRNIICRAQGVHPRKIYRFDEKNKYTIVPDTFEDFYFLLKVNDIVLANDPKAKDIRGRPNVEKSINETSRQKNIDAAIEAEKNDRAARIKKFKEDKFKEKMEQFGHDIAEGKATVIPDNAEIIAKEYAESEVSKEFGANKGLKVLLPAMKMLPCIDSI
jgi:hypothetical protein